MRFATTQIESCIKIDRFICGDFRVTSDFRQTHLLFLCFFKEHLINLLENGIERLKRAERYEVMGTVYKLAVPLYEEDRDFSVSLHNRCTNINPLPRCKGHSCINHNRQGANTRGSLEACSKKIFGKRL